MLVFKDVALPLVFEFTLQCVLAKGGAAVCYCNIVKLVTKYPISIFSIKSVEKVELFCYCSPFV